MRRRQALMIPAIRPRQHLPDTDYSTSTAWQEQESAFSRREVRPSFTKSPCPSDRRAQGMPGAWRTHSLACKNKKHGELATTGSPKHSGIPRANGFNGFLRDLPGDRAFLSPSPCGIFPQGLMPASRHQDHTTSPSAGRGARPAPRPRPSHPAPNVRDDRETPLLNRAQDGADDESDLRFSSMRGTCGTLARRANHRGRRKTCQGFFRSIARSNCFIT
jgi:hypothetical protein